MKISKIFAIASAAVLIVACGAPVEGSKETKALYPKKSQIDSASYLLGINYASWLKSNNFTDLNYDQLVRGIKDWLKAEGNTQDSTFFKQFKIDPNEKMQPVLDGFVSQIRQYSGALNKEKGAAYIQKFLKEEGVQQTETGLCYKIIEPGNDKKAVSDMDTVWVDYRGALLDDTVFDENENINFTLGRVIPGWSQGMKLIGEGGKIKLVIPGDLAYGEYGNRGIEPNSTLIFDVTLNKVGTYVEPVKEEEAPAKKK